MLPMPLHQIAFVCSVVLLFALCVMQVMLRRQAHDANYGTGNREISPWDVRYLNDMGAIWKAHKKAYERSALRSVFVVVTAVWLVSVLVAVVALVAKS